ncbi:MAG: zinc metalloprotease HtpX [Methyloligellaceae bacterium]
MSPYLDPAASRAHKTRNVIHSVVLIGGLGLLMGLCAWILWGWIGHLYALIAAAITILFGPRVAPEMVMRMYRARPVDRTRGGTLFQLVEELARRAELPAMPKLYVVPSAALNAFAVGRPDDASIAITQGLLRRLSLREVAGVLAHEMSHIRNNDLWIMGLADTFSRITQMMSWVGIFLLILNLPAALKGQVVVPWLAVLLLYFAPTIGSLLQLALSRAREYDADLEGAQLTGDPTGLASALDKLERYQGRFWEDMLMPGRRIPQPSLLRSHPPTEERVRRLLDLRRPELPPLRLPQRASPADLLHGFVAMSPGPRFRWPGVWF